MSLELDPAELGFKRPFTHEVAEVLRLKNPTKDPIAFKVKTTAPKQYCVRPNSGRIEPGEDAEIQVLLQAMKEDPPEGTKCRDKFLVQSVAVSADQDSTNIASVWSNIEQTAKSSIQEKKIRVSFLSAEGTATFTPSRSRHSTLSVEPREYGSPVTAASTPNQHSISNGTSLSGTSETKAGVVSGPYTGSQHSGLSAVTSSTADASPASTNQFKEQLAEAQATIARLTKQIQEQTLRQRKSDAVSKDATEKVTSGTTTAMGTQQAAPSGVPVPIVAALCLLSFLLAYLLF